MQPVDGSSLFEDILKQQFISSPEKCVWLEEIVEPQLKMAE